jgi:hypothetical protein
MVAVGHMLDTHVIGTGSALRTAIIFFYIANEGLSLLENTTRLGLPVPAKLKDVLAQLHQKPTEPAPSESDGRDIVVPPHPGAVTAKPNETEDDE